MERKFKTLIKKEEVDLIPYIKEYLQKYPETDILIGCDSQNRKRNTIYAVCVVLYRPGCGGHVLFSRNETPRIKVEKGNFDKMRLLNETWYSIEIAEKIREEIGVKAKWIDVDINNDSKWKSNTVLSEALGLVDAYGYSSRYKNSPNTPIVTYCCDQLVKQFFSSFLDFPKFFL